MDEFKYVASHLADTKAHVVAVSGFPIEEFSRYLHEQALKIANYSVDRLWLAQSGLGATPTVALLSAGKVDKIWFGKLNRGRSDEILKAVQTKL